MSLAAAEEVLEVASADLPAPGGVAEDRALKAHLQNYKYCNQCKVVKHRSSCHRKGHTFQKMIEEQKQVEVEKLKAKRQGDVATSRALVEQQRQQHR